MKGKYNENVVGVDPRCALLEGACYSLFSIPLTIVGHIGHLGTTQLQYYNDSYVSACAHGYHQLEKYAANDVTNNRSLVNNVKRALSIVEYVASIHLSSTTLHIRVINIF